MRKDLGEFKKFIKGKKVAVVGIGISNTPLIKMMVKLGANVSACDRKEDLGELKNELQCLGVTLYLGEDYLKNIKNSDVIFRTPALRPDNEYIKEARENGAYITSEMGEFLKYCPCKIFGITGSDGKTTTSTLISEMLKQEGYRVHLGGNIGTPLFNIIEEINKDDFAVVELSSFQLMDVKYSPDIAVITNLSPNHLDIHKGMEEYINSKKNIFKHQDKDGIVILNENNDVTAAMKNDISVKLRMFSINDKNTYSHLDGDKLIVGGKFICNVEDVKLPGMHNIENLLTAAAAVDGYVSTKRMEYVAKNFSGVEHRIEFVREIDGIKFYNDSIASSPTRTAAGLKSFKQRVILIAGGYDKKIPFDVLAQEGINRVKLLVIMGKTKDKIRAAFDEEMKLSGHKVEIIEASSLEDAVNIAYSNSNTGDIITLSPACASFDMFKNFEERGNKYKDIVMKLS